LTFCLTIFDQSFSSCVLFLCQNLCHTITKGLCSWPSPLTITNQLRDLLLISDRNHKRSRAAPFTLSALSSWCEQLSASSSQHHQLLVLQLSLLNSRQKTQIGQVQPFRGGFIGA
jgi:hypothetical protein